MWHTANVEAFHVTIYFQVFKKKIQEFREACYALTGFKIDVIRDNQYRLQSMYAERSTDDLLFEVSCTMTLFSTHLQSAACDDRVRSIVRGGARGCFKRCYLVTWCILINWMLSMEGIKHRQQIWIWSEIPSMISIQPAVSFSQNSRQYDPIGKLVSPSLT